MDAILSSIAAVALAEIKGAEAAVAELDLIGRDKRMADYQPYWAARGHLLALIGNASGAHEAIGVAAGLTQDPAVRAYLLARQAALPDA